MNSVLGLPVLLFCSDCQCQAGVRTEPMMMRNDHVVLPDIDAVSRTRDPATPPRPLKRLRRDAGIFPVSSEYCNAAMHRVSLGTGDAVERVWAAILHRVMYVHTCWSKLNSAL